MARSWWIAGWNSGNVATGATQFGPLVGTSQFGNPETDDMTRPIGPLENGAVLSELSTNCTLQQHTSMDGVIRVNGADTALENVHTGTGVLTNLSDQVTLSDGDKVATLRRPAGAGGSSRIGWFAGVLESPDTKAARRHAVQFIGGGTEGSEAFQSNSTTEWVNLIGRTAANQGTEDLGSAAIRVRGTFDFRHLFVTVDANTRATDSHFISRVNFADGNQQVIITAGVTGTFENLSDGETVQWGDQIGAAGRNFTGGGSWNMQISGAELVDFNGRLGVQGLGDGIGQGHNPNQTRLVSLSDDFNTTFNFDHLYVVPYRQTAGFFHCPISANANIQETEQILMVDNAQTDVGQVTPPLTSGDFENLADTVIIRETSVISGIRLYTGSGSSGTITYEGTITFHTTSAPHFKVETRGFNTAPDGTPLGMGQPVCIQIGPSVTPAPPAGGLSLAGLLPTIHETAGEAFIIEVPAGNICIRGPHAASVDVPIPVPVGSLTFTGQTPTCIVGQTAEMPAGSLVLAGQTPTRIENSIRQPGAGALVLAGAQASLDFELHPSAGSLVFAGLAPVAFVERVAAPPAGALVLAGLAPAMDFELHPGAGALVFQGQAPTRLTSLVRAPGAGALVFAGQAPTLGFDLHPGAGALVLAGQTPQAFVQRVAAPGAGLLVLAGQTPLRLIDDPTPVPVGTLLLAGQNPTLDFVCPAPAGALTFTGLVPGIFEGLLITIPVGSLVLAGQTPTRIENSIRQPGAGALVFTGQAASLSQAIPVPSGDLSLAGQTPVRLVNDPTPVPAGVLALNPELPAITHTLPVPVGALVFEGQLPAIFTTILRSMPAGALVLQGQAPQAFVQRIAAPPTGALVLQGELELLAFGLPLPAGALVFTGQAPAALTGLLMEPGAGSLVLAGLAPTLSHTIPVPAGSLTFTGLAPTTGAAVTIEVPAGALVLAGLSPELGYTIPIDPGGTLVLAGLAPSRLTTESRAPGVGALVLQGLAPTAQVAVDIPVPAGALVLAGLLPAVVQSNILPAGTLALAGLAPTCSILPSNIPTGALVLAGHAPTVGGDFVINVPTADCRLTGHALDIPTSDSIAVLRGSMLLEGDQPYVGHGSFPGAGSCAFAGQVPTVTQTQVSPAGALVLQGHAPTCVTSSLIIDVPTGALVLQGLVPGGAAANTPAPGVAACTLTGLAPRAVSFPSDPLNPPNKQTFSIVRERQGPFIVDEQGWIYTHMLQLDLETGIGLDVLAGVLGENPQIEMTYSDDNARTWSTPRLASGGRIGKYRTRAIWRRLGRSRKRVYRIRVTDPVKWAIVDAYARITKGTS
jgi:hypothetical protein